MTGGTIYHAAIIMANASGELRQLLKGSLIVKGYQQRYAQPRQPARDMFTPTFASFAAG